MHANLVFQVYIVFEFFSGHLASAYWNATLSCPSMGSNYANVFLVPISFWSRSANDENGQALRTGTALAIYYIYLIPYNFIYVMHCNWLHYIKCSRTKCMSWFLCIWQSGTSTWNNKAMYPLTRNYYENNSLTIIFRNFWGNSCPLNLREKKTFFQNYAWNS